MLTPDSPSTSRGELEARIEAPADVYSGAVKPSCWKEKGSNAKPFNTDACITKLTQHKIKPDAPDSHLVQAASCLKISDDGQVTVKDTPAPVVARVHQEATQALNSPEVVGKLRGLGADVRSSTPEAMRTLVTSEIKRWGQVIDKAGIRATQ